MKSYRPFFRCVSPSDHDMLSSTALSCMKDCVLFMRHADGDLWKTPGGMIEPYEIPADAAVQDMWEATGLYVQLTHVIGVFGGFLFCYVRQRSQGFLGIYRIRSSTNTWEA